MIERLQIMRFTGGLARRARMSFVTERFQIMRFTGGLARRARMSSMTGQFQPQPRALRTILRTEADGSFWPENGSALSLSCGYDTISLPVFQGRVRIENPPPRTAAGEDLLKGKG